MFFVIEKEKLSAYIVSIATVLSLFIIAGAANPNTNTIETGANVLREMETNNTSIIKDNEENKSGNKELNNNYFEQIKTE